MVEKCIGMKAIILAAGRGSRMHQLTDDRPKCLIELRGKPLLEWQMEALRSAGINDIGIVTGYRREQLKDYGLVEFHNPAWATTQMVSSLTAAAAWLAQSVCIISYSDIFYDSSAVRALMQCDADLAITYDPAWLELWSDRFTDPLLDAETFRVAADGRLLEIGNKPKSVEEIQGQYMGLVRMTPQGWQQLTRLRSTMQAKDRDAQHMTTALQSLIELTALRMIALPYTGDWGEIDNQNDLMIYE